MDRADAAVEPHTVTSMESVRRRAPKLGRRAIEQIVRSGKRLLVQGAMGIHASDGLSGKVAAIETPHLVGVGTISAVLKNEPLLRTEIRRTRAEAPSGYIGLNLMAAINRIDFDTLLRISFEEGISFIVQGAVTRLTDRSAQALPSVREIFDMFEATLAAATPEAAAGAGAP
jgi:NAD(P)H-dependent flavin oxidoreductase YrpB (nitropropane dioxygenase family)